MDHQEIYSKLELAVHVTVENLRDFSDETSASEWNISHHLCRNIEILFPEYDCDPELIKRNHGNMRPDFTVHKRGTNRQNLLIGEVKRNAKHVPADVAKIRGHWFAGALNYRFGAVVVIDDEHKFQIHFMQNERQADQSA